MVTLSIDDRVVQAEEGKTILEVAQGNNIYIPTLCHHEGVSPYGACRLCIVEITRRGRERLVAACIYTISQGLVVKTKTPRVTNVRRMVMELLLARCPDSEVLQELANKMEIDGTRFAPEENNRKCILCALCTRACQEVVGVSAISLVNRGVNRQMATPFNDFSKACIACGSCSYICPTGAISVEDVGDTRTLTLPYITMEFKLKRCNNCGRYWAPEKQLEYMAEKSGLEPAAFDLCTDCRD